MKIQEQNVEECLTSLRSGVNGLQASEAQRRLLEFGPNRIREERKRPWALLLLREFSQLFSIVLWLAAGLAFVLSLMAPGQGMARLGIALIVVILISGFFSFWQEFRVEKALAALRQFLPHRVQVQRDGHALEIDAQALVPGDVVLLEQGANIPADCRLIEAYAVRVNNANLTGEAIPQPRNCEPSDAELLIRAGNILLAGTSLVAGRGKAVVFATGMHTEFGRIAHLTQTAGEGVSPLRREVSHISRLIMILAVSLGALFWAAGWWIGLSPQKNFVFALGIIVAMVPEGLLPTLTLALVLATQSMARRRVLIRHLPAVEALGAATVICTDKTGTLTQNRMRAMTVLPGAAALPVPAGASVALAAHYAPMFLAAGLCHDLTEIEQGGRRSWQGDPMELALVDLAQQANVPLPHWKRIDELPFDGQRMRLSTIYAGPQGPTLYCKGAAEPVLQLCTRALADAGEQPLTQTMRDAVLGAQERMADTGLRVIALAYRPVDAGVAIEDGEHDLIFAGLVGMEDPPRQEVPAAIEQCHHAGIKVIMLTGDHPRTALAVARNIGLVRSANARVISGEQLRRLSDTQLQLALDEPEVHFARLGAEQKTRIVEALKRKGHIVAVTGDGVNDAPALKSAHVGVAMGRSGTDVAKEAADVVILDDNFASIVAGIEEGRAVFDNIRKFLTYILAHNVPELVPYLAFVFFPIPLALTPIQMLAVDMGTDSLTALGLGVEPPEPDVMRRAPRSPRERLLDWRLAVRAYLFLGLLEAAAVMSVFLVTLRAAGWHYGDALAATAPLYLHVTTVALGAIVLLQVVNVFLCRSPTRSVWGTGLLGNRLILAGVGVEVGALALIAYTPLGNAIFGTAPIAPVHWAAIGPFAVALLVLEEGRKWWVRRIWRQNLHAAEAS
ncbi:cation-transporting P-type ATPase [Thiomonas sp. FB-Cd]|uniref:cation-translocating P-type ATPase n=1 Tax=Thiomonas sp. FB-Cd TaxID=1158292 RepID=UPI0004DFB9D0|nr:cation-transporting P-type ATPase [Thiomonas sp. FB-Cd]